MNETEVERLVVRLSGDASEYKKELAEAISATNQAAEEVKESAEKVEASWADSIAGIGRELQETMKDWQAFKEESLAAFAEAEVVDAKLTATLEANGRAVQGLMDDYAAFSDEVQNLLGVSDEAVKMVLRTAETFGLTGDAAKAAAKDAYSLASITDGSAQAMIRMAAAVQKGNIEQAMAFSRMIPQLRGVKDEMEFLTKYQQLVVSGWKAAEAAGNTHQGMVNKIKEAYGNLQEEFGKFTAEGQKLELEVQLKLIKWLQSLPSPLKYVAYLIGTITLALAGFLTILPSAVDGLKLLQAELLKSMTLLGPFIIPIMKLAAIGTVAAVGVYAVGKGIGFIIDQLTGSKAAAQDAEAALIRVASWKEKNVAFGTETDVLVGKAQKDANQGNSQAVDEAIAKAWESLSSAQEVLRGAMNYGTKDEVKQATDRVGLALDRVNKLQDVHAKTNEEAAKTVNDLIQKYKDQAAHANMSASQVDRLKASQAGATAAQLEAFDAASREAAQTKQQKQERDKLNSSLEKTIEQLELEIATYGKSKEQVALYKLEKLGATEVELARVRALQEEKKALEDAEKAQKKQMDAVAGMFEKANQMLKDAETPAEKYADKVALIDEMFRMNIITQEEWNKLQDKAAEDFDKAMDSMEKKAKATKHAVHAIRNEAVLAGSSEAQALVATFRSSVSTDLGETDKEQLAEMKNQTGILAAIRDKPAMVLEAV